MNQDKPIQPLRLLALISTPKSADRAEVLFQKENVPTHFRTAAKGTAPSDMTDILGLGSVDKNLLAALLPKASADRMLPLLKKNLKLGSVNSGIAFTLPLSGISRLMFRILEQYHEEAESAREKKEDRNMSESHPYTLIAAAVNPGYSDAAVHAAREAGAKGGTLLHSRSVSDGSLMQSWGLNTQDEKEILLIVADTETKQEIMKAISEACGLKSEAKGIVLSLPIDHVIGLGD